MNINLTLKEMRFILEIMDRVPVQGIEAKELQLQVMKKVSGPLQKAQAVVDTQKKRKGKKKKATARRN